MTRRMWADRRAELLQTPEGRAQYEAAQQQLDELLAQTAQEFFVDLDKAPDDDD